MKKLIVTEESLEKARRFLFMSVHDYSDIWQMLKVLFVEEEKTYQYRCPVCNTSPAIPSVWPDYACTNCANIGRFKQYIAEIEKHEPEQNLKSLLEDIKNNPEKYISPMPNAIKTKQREWIKEFEGKWFTHGYVLNCFSDRWELLALNGTRISIIRSCDMNPIDWADAEIERL